MFVHFPPHGAARRGGAAIATAIELPLVIVCLAGAADCVRFFDAAATVTRCAHKGAIYASRPTSDPQAQSPSLSEAALADASHLSPSPTVTAAHGSDQGGAYVDVTVSYPFRTSGHWGMIPPSVTLSRTVRIVKPPDAPR